MLLLALGVDASIATPPTPGASSSPVVGKPLPAPWSSGPPRSVEMGKVNVISIDDLPADERKALRALRADADSGYVEVGDNDGLWLTPLPQLVEQPGQTTRGRLVFKPLELRGRDLPGLQYLGAWADEIAHQGEPILSAQRYFQRNDGVVVGLAERALTPQTAVVVVKELQNAQVGSRPAQMMVQRSPGGRTRSVLMWADERADYTLTVEDDVRRPASPQYGKAWMLDVAQRLVR